MGVAADDTITKNHHFISSSGALGTGKCIGLVLINTLGPISSGEGVDSVACNTSNGSLKECNSLRRGKVELISKSLFWLMLVFEPLLPGFGRIFYRANPSVMNRSYFDAIIRDSMDVGVINVIVTISKLLPKRTAEELLCPDGRKSIPHEGVWIGKVLLVQGMLDPLKSQERAKKLVTLRDGITLAPLQCGHCPHDEMPSETALAIVKWMNDNYPQ